MKKTTNQETSEDKASYIKKYLDSNPNFMVDYLNGLSSQESMKIASYLSIDLSEVESEYKKRHQEITNTFEKAVQFNIDISKKINIFASRLLQISCAEQKKRESYFMKEIVTHFELDGVVIIDRNHKEAASVFPRVEHFESVGDEKTSLSMRKKFFGEKTQVKSLAFVPLVEKDEVNRVLILGSKSTERFRLSLGTQYLDQLGNLVQCFLYYCVSNGK